MYQHHRWRSEGFHGEAKTWHGPGRAVRRGLDNVKIQSYLTATVINLKQLAAAVVVRFCSLWMACVVWNRCLKVHDAHKRQNGFGVTQAA